MEINVTTSDLVTVQEAANCLGKPRVTIYRWVRTNKVLGLKLGGILYIPKSEVERLREGKGSM